VLQIRVICGYKKLKMKPACLLLATILSLSCYSQSTPTYTEQYRPQYHFSPAVNWTNDPNGLVYVNSAYHLFYQYNPFGNVWGHMSWGHAVSYDLVHWQHLPVAIPEASGVMIFSGSCVYDKNNTSGLGKKGKDPMVAIYTGHTATNQSQYIAYSLDDGKTWTKYSKNPVLDIHKKDFRDPKVFWHEPTKKWVMAVMLSPEHKVQFYGSKNLIDWNLLSEFGPAGDTSGVWECPDLFQANIEGTPDKKWVLTMSISYAMQYFVGEFDGITFRNENPATKIFRPDYGPDYYAAISYNNLPLAQEPTMIGWCNNWNYANDIPTSPWKSAFSLPRNISVKKVNDEWLMIQQPIKAIDLLRIVTLPQRNIVVNGTAQINTHSQQLQLHFNFHPFPNTIEGVRLAVGNDHYFEIGYDVANQKLYIDRSKTANQNFNPKFQQLSRYETALSSKGNNIDLNIYFDNSIVEVFANDGECVMTTQIFPNKDENGIELFSNNGITNFINVNIAQMKSAWK
jgi:fructan beta-fructosidase